jgi:hypothetical protein
MFKSIVYVDDEDVRKIRAIAVARHGSHGEQCTRRFYENPNEEDTIGIFGEYCFAGAFGLPTKDVLKVNSGGAGDGGVDFPTPIGTIDVKTYRKAYNLLVKESDKNHPADIYVLAQFNENDNSVELLGWEWGKAVFQWPMRDFGYGLMSYYKHRSQLQPIRDLYNKIHPPASQAIITNENLKLEDFM